MKTHTLLLSILIAVAVTAPAAGQTLIDAYGHAELATQAGETTTVLAVVRDAPATSSPLTTDFSGFEYTLVISGLTLDVAGNPQSSSGGTVSVYEDAGSAADLGDSGTFADGSLLLEGTLATLERFDSSLEGLSSFVGTINWTGGSQLDQLTPADGWKLLGAANSKSAASGFDEAWDFKIEPPQVSAPLERRSWGDVKGIFGS